MKRIFFVFLLGIGLGIASAPAFASPLDLAQDILENAKAQAFLGPLHREIALPESTLVVTGREMRGSDRCRTYEIKPQTGGSQLGIICQNKDDGALYESH